jgi:hypothetical protein
MRNHFFFSKTSFCLLIFSFGVLSCTKSETPPPTLEQDPTLQLMEKEISELEVDLSKMQARMDYAQSLMDENALRPKLLDMTRKEYYKYDKLARQIEQEIAYKKIRMAMRTRTLGPEIKSLTLEQLAIQAEDYKASLKAVNKKYPWRELSLPEPPSAKDKEKDAKESKDNGEH